MSFSKLRSVFSQSAFSWLPWVGKRGPLSVVPLEKDYWGRVIKEAGFYPEKTPDGKRTTAYICNLDGKSDYDTSQIIGALDAKGIVYYARSDTNTLEVHFDPANYEKSVANMRKLDKCLKYDEQSSPQLDEKTPG